MKKWLIQPNHFVGIVQTLFGISLLGSLGVTFGTMRWIETNTWISQAGYGVWSIFFGLVLIIRQFGWWRFFALTAPTLLFLVMQATFIYVSGLSAGTTILGAGLYLYTLLRAWKYHDTG